MIIWLAAAFAAFGAGALGAFVLVRRLSHLVGSLSHTVFAGLGFALWLQRVHGWTWAEPMLGAAISGVLAAIIIGLAHIYFREREEALMTLLWSVGMAIGLVFIFLTPDYEGDLHDFLFGSLIWVDVRQLLWIAGLDLALLTTLIWQRNRFVAVCFDEQLAKIEGLNVPLLYTGLLALIALAVVALIHMIGIILVLALIIIPPMIASRWDLTFFWLAVTSSLIGPVLALIGCALAAFTDLPPSPVIALVAGGLYIASAALKRRAA